KTVSTFQQFPQVELQTAAHTPYRIGFIGIRIFLPITIFIDKILASDKVLEVGRSDLGRVLKRDIHILTIPIKILRDVHGRDRKSKRLSIGITFSHDLIISPIDHIHFRLEMLIGQIFQIIDPSLLGKGFQDLISNSSEQMLSCLGWDLVPQVLRDIPIEGNIGKWGLPPTSRNIKVIYEATDS